MSTGFTGHRRLPVNVFACLNSRFRPLRRVTESVLDIATSMHPNLFENHQ
jgi:hypothetical protein